MGIDGILYWPGLTDTYEIKTGPFLFPTLIRTLRS